MKKEVLKKGKGKLTPANGGNFKLQYKGTTLITDPSQRLVVTTYGVPAALKAVVVAKAAARAATVAASRAALEQQAGAAVGAGVRRDRVRAEVKRALEAAGNDPQRAAMISVEDQLLAQNILDGR